MEKRILIATGLAFLVLLMYQPYLKKLGVQPQRKTVVTQASKKPNDTVVPYDTVDIETVQTDDTVADTVLENDLLKLTVNERTGTVKEIYFWDHGTSAILYSLQNKGLGLFAPTVSTVSFQSRLGFSANDMVLEGQRVKRSYKLEEHILTTVFEGEKEISIFIPTKYDVSPREARYVRMVIKNTDGLSYDKPSKLMKNGGTLQNVDWFALSFRYHSLLFDPDNIVDLGIIPSLSRDGFIIKIKLDEARFSIATYLGPNSANILESYNQSWLGVLNYGTLNNVVKTLLVFFHKITHNYGSAILLLAMLLNLIFSPLTLKSQRSMKGMQKLQPEIQALKEQYKDNPQAVNKEMLQLYKKHKVNPMGGCLPMLLQIPVFIALYNTLMRSYELKNATFLWIKDLSAPDRLVMLGKALPLIGNEINLLPLLMAGLMFAQQKLSPAAKMPGAGAQNPNMMLWLMPIFMGAIFYKFPAGLVLYWFTNSLFMLVLQMARK
ncbi:MAG: membrane protein insertase YidC [Candidatus Saelkia tenebricola]|nr:membrane protein insertase YidC [Candidatus Saelkia tenebricola]